MRVIDDPVSRKADEPAGGWRMEFPRIPLAARAWVSATLLGAVTLPIVLRPLGPTTTAHDEDVTALALIGLSILNVEIGRLLEGGVATSQRPHKALSAWAFATALLLPTGWLLPVVAITYAHAWWRGMRVTPWKWVGSAGYIVLAGLAAAIGAKAVMGAGTNLMQGDGHRGLLAVLAAASVFLLVETVCFHGSAYLNDARSEEWLRTTLASPSFYLTEACVLMIGGLSAAIWTGGTWFVVLLAPVYALTQRAALHEPLRERAEHDGKTGALHYESWRRLALSSVEGRRRRDHPWGILFADLDHFKAFNDTWGHLVGDQALIAVAEAIRGELRPDDLLGRFGGEEFCIFLPDVDADEAARVSERIRLAVAATVVPGAAPVTISVGVAVVGPEQRAEFGTLLAAADRALFAAKAAGRNCTSVEVVAA